MSNQFTLHIHKRYSIFSVFYDLLHTLCMYRNTVVYEVIFLTQLSKYLVNALFITKTASFQAKNLLMLFL